MPPTPLEPIDATRLVREVDRELVRLLRSLEEKDWQRPAVGH